MSRRMRSGSVTSHGRGPTEAPWKTPNSSGMGAGYSRIDGSLTSETRSSPEVKEILERDGVYYEPSAYGERYPISKHLIEEGRSHLIGEGLLHLHRPVRILQRMC